MNPVGLGVGIGVGMGVEDLEEKWVRGVESGEKGSKVVT
jgi:hypothetical protein